MRSSKSLVVHYRATYAYLQYATKQAASLVPKQRLLLQNALSNFAADYPVDFPLYLPVILGGKGTKDVDNPHLAIIQKYSLLLSLKS